MNWPLLSVIIITFKRPKEIRMVIDSIIDHVDYPNMEFVIADDCTPIAGYTDDLKSQYSQLNIKISQPDENSGWGVNANLAMKKANGEYIYFTEDDYVLTHDIDLKAGVALLQAHIGIGLIRYDGISGHRLIGHLSETDISDIYPQYRQGVNWPGVIHYWLLDSRSPSLNIYSNRPHLKHRRFHEFYGVYVEGAKLGETEDNMAHRVKDSMPLPNAPALAAPVDVVTKYIDDIGVSYQGSEYDK